jgi:hypothetical protein
MQSASRLIICGHYRRAINVKLNFKLREVSCRGCEHVMLHKGRFPLVHYIYVSFSTFFGPRRSSEHFWTDFKSRVDAIMKLNYIHNHFLGVHARIIIHVKTGLHCFRFVRRWTVFNFQSAGHNFTAHAHSELDTLYNRQLAC